MQMSIFFYEIETSKYLGTSQILKKIPSDPKTTILELNDYWVDYFLIYLLSSQIIVCG